ncbi:hypothetical protein Q5752_001604 [Cryptotrichosporon argae]
MPARRICLAAARDILDARMRTVPPLFLRPWLIVAYTITAGLICGTELTHGATSPAERVGLVAGLAALHDKLDDCGAASFVVRRGKPMLASFLERARAAEQASPATAAAAAALPDLGELWPVIALEHGSFDVQLWNQSFEAQDGYADPNTW